MQSYGCLRGPLSDIIKCIGSPSRLHSTTPRRHVSSALHGSAVEQDEDSGRATEHFSNAPDLETSGDDVLPDPTIVDRVAGLDSLRPSRTSSRHPAAERLLGAPQPQLARVVERTGSSQYKRSYKISQGAMKARLEDQKRYHLEHHGYDDSGTWPIILDTLSRATLAGPARHMKRTETVRIAEGSPVVFKGNSGATIAEIMQRTGSHVQIVPSKNYGRSFTALTLYGQPRQNAEALNILPLMVRPMDELSGAGQIEPQMLQSELERELDSQERAGQDPEVPAMRESPVGVYDQRHAKLGVSDGVLAKPARAYWNIEHVEDMTAKERIARRPKQWNTLALTQYVELLVAAVPPSYRRISREGGEQSTDGSYNDLMTRELCSIFIDSPGLGNYISSDAVDTAFAFLLRCRDFPTIHRIIATAESSDNYSLTASNYDMLFAHAAKLGDLHNFRYILQTMLRSEVQPTDRVWLRFHQLVCSRFPPNVAAKVMKRMTQKGMMASPKVVREMADNMITPALADYMTMPEASVSHLVRAMDKMVNSLVNSSLATPTQPGKSWLTVSAANKMIDFALSQGRQQDAFAIVDELQRRDEKFDIWTLNTFLTSKARSFDLPGSLAVLEHFHDITTIPEHAIPLNSVTFWILFGVAHRAKSHNVMRVLWRYACVSGCVPKLLPKMTSNSLYSHLPSFEEWTKFPRQFDLPQDMMQRSPQDLTHGIVSHGLWGKFVVGLSEGLSPLAAQLPKSYDETVQAMTERRRLRELTSLERSVVDFALTPRPDNNSRSPRPQALQATLRADLTEHLSLRPVIPFVEMLRKAWEVDVAMKQSRLDVVPTELKGDAGDPEREQMLRAHLANMLEDMLAWGVEIPMKTSMKRVKVCI